jgi:hypothetical protein
VVPGLASLAQMPCPATIPFRVAPDPRPFRGRGRLCHFLPFWREVLETPPHLLQAVEGYHPPFMSPPLLACPRVGFSTPSQGANNHFINLEVEAMLEKGAIEEVPLFPPPPSFISNIFLVKKKNWGMRPVINLRRLNAAHLDTLYFRMETPQDVRHTFRPGDWAASIDLRDAYFHIPIHAADRKFLHFGWRGRLFQFCVLPFCLSPGGFHDQVFACPWASLWGRGGSSLSIS